MKKLINDIVLYYFFIFRRKEFERRIEFAAVSFISSLENTIHEVSFLNPMLTK